MNNREILLGAIARCKARMEYGRDHSNGRDLQILCDCAEALLAEIDKLEALGGWQDISTAPKDGGYLLLANANCQIQPFDRYIGAWRFPQTYEPGGMSLEWRDYSGRYSSPTHWQPLPAQPKQGESND